MSKRIIRGYYPVMKNQEKSRATCLQFLTCSVQKKYFKIFTEHIWTGSPQSILNDNLGIIKSENISSGIQFDFEQICTKLKHFLREPF